MNLNKKLFCIFACTLFFIMSCSSLPTYKPKEWSFSSVEEGYYDEIVGLRKGANGAKVAYSSKQGTEPDITKRYLLYRCAEVSKENNASYFIIFELNDLTTIHEGIGSRIPRFSTTIIFITEDQAAQMEATDPQLLRLNGIYETSEVLTVLAPSVKR